MPTTIIWTAVPAGVGPNNRLKLSVYLSPRLTGVNKETTLAEFAMFQDWPAQVAKIQQQIQVRYGATVIKPVAYGPLPNSEYWRNLFKPATLVKSYAWQERTNKIKNRWRGVRSYPADDVHGIVREKYVKLAKDNPTNPPVAATLIREENLGLIGFHGGAGTPVSAGPEAIITNRLEQKFLQNKFVPRTQIRGAGGQRDVDATREAMLQVKHFFVRPSQLAVRAATERATRLKQAPPPPPPIAPPPPLDFHEQLGALGSYPFMMRQVGIVIDLELQIPAGTPPATDVQIVAPTMAGVTSVTPKTKVTAQFLPMSNARPDPADPTVASDVINGMLKLGEPKKPTDPKYQVVMLDLDGAALNLMKFATDMQRSEEIRLQKLEKASITEAQGNPSYADFCSQGNVAIAAQQPLAQKLAISKHIVDKAGQMKEEPLPALRSAGITVIRSERNKKTVSTIKRQVTLHEKVAAPPGVARAGEEEVLWADDLVRGYAVDIFSSATGKWHSVCSRIGTYEFLDAPGTKISDIVDEAAVEAAGVEDKVTTDLYAHEAIFRWTGWSLAVPRPGKSLDDKSNLAPREGRDKFQKGLRLTAEFKVPPGSLPKLRYGTKYKVRARVVDLAGNVLPPTSPLANTPDVATKEFTYVRFSPVAAPQISLCAEPKPAESTMHLVIRSNYNTPLYEPETQRYITPPPGTEGMAEEHGRLDGAQNMMADKAGLKTYDVVRNNDRTLRDVKRAQNEAIKPDPMPNEPPLVFPPGSLTEVPYLPDPLANGALVRNVPAAGPRKNLAVPFSAAPNWFDARPFRIRVVEGNQNPEYDAAQRVLTIFLPKGERYDDLLLSTVPEGAAVDYLGVNQWLAEMNVPAATRMEVVKHMRDGVHWMTSPHYSISIVHALQQPLTPPKFGSLRSHREIGDTYTVLVDQNLAVHGKSTLKVDIEGAWNEWVDNPRRGLPKQIDRKAIAFDVPVLRHQTSLHLPADPPKLQHVANREFQAVQAADFARIQPNLQIAQAILAYQKPGYRHEFHDTKHRMVAYKAVGFTRFKEYFADKVGLKDEDFQRESAPVNVNVLNAARPDAPKIAYIIPNFGWTKSKNGATITSKRTGGLRIYLERPWYSSGNGEKLAVVLMRDAQSRPKIDTHISLWGKDPIWKTPSRRISELHPGDFPLVSKDRNLQNFSLSQTAVSANTSFSALKKAQTPVQASPSVKAQPSLQAQPAAGKLNPGLVALLRAQLLTLAEFNDDPAMSVLVAAHDVFFDENRGLWYCDIEINMPEEYFPFVRLALARFQPNSLEHCHLSRVVKAEMIQLTPERTLTIAPAGSTGSEFRVTHTGVTYDAPGRAGLSSAMRNPPAGPNLIRVTIEQKRDDGGGNLGWVPIASDPYELKFLRMEGKAAVHQEVVSIPGADLSRFRLVVQEFEMHYGGDDIRSRESEGRLIYADAIPMG